MRRDGANVAASSRIKRLVNPSAMSTMALNESRVITVRDVARVARVLLTPVRRNQAGFDPREILVIRSG